MATDDDLASAPTAASGLGASVSPSTDDRAPSVIADRYEILGLLGAGGMGRVYRAHDKTLDEIVALKTLRRELIDRSGMLERFRQEVKLARRVTHANVVRTFDLGQHGDEHFLTMEYIEGRSLAQLLEDGPLAVDEVLRIARAAAGGIAAAHAGGVLHRDLKPDNILVGKSGRIAITDFGIATAATSPVATSDRFAGTPAYMAPEQVESGQIGPATDVYAFGAILYEMLSGRRPFRGQDVIQVAVARLHQPPPDPRHVRAVPDALATLCIRCMARAPGDRFSDGAALANALGELGDISAVSRTAPPLSVQATPAKTSRSVAILPLRASGDLADLGDGLAEEIVDALSMTRALRVRPLASVRKAAASEADARDVGAQLGVDVVVEGSIRRRGAHVRISARVIGIADGFQLWASHFDAAPDTLLAASDDVVRAVARALTVEMDMPVRSASDPRATELYLAGKTKLRTHWLDSNLDAAIAPLEEALVLAPDDPGIMSTLATALARAAFWGAGPSVLARARQLADRATALAPSLGDAWFARAVAAVYSSEFADGINGLVKACMLSPGFAMAQAMLGGIALELGLLDAAFLHLEAANSLDPGIAHIDLPRAYVYAGRWEDALRTLSTRENHTRIFDEISKARFHMWRGERYDVPRTLPHDASPNVNAFAEIAMRVHRTGVLTPEDRAHLEEITESQGPRLRASRAQFLAEFLLFTHDPDAALHWVGVAVDHGLHDVLWMQKCPMLEPLRSRPEFIALEQRVAERARVVLDALELPEK